MTKEAAKEAIAEYVKVAEAALEAEYPGNYTQDTVMKLASAMIEEDVAYAELEKEAEIILEAAFVDEFNKLAGANAKSAGEIFEAIQGFARNIGQKAKTRVKDLANRAGAAVEEAKPKIRAKYEQVKNDFTGKNEKMIEDRINSGKYYNGQRAVLEEDLATAKARKWLTRGAVGVGGAGVVGGTALMFKKKKDN